MKRILSLFLCSLIILVSCLAVLPASAEDELWSTLFYEYDPPSEGETGERVKLETSTSSAESRLQLFETVTVSCDDAQADLFVNGELVEGGSYRLSVAGNYDIKVQKSGSAAAVNHYFQIFPDLGFGSGHIFASNPIISCTNATLEIKKGNVVWDPALPLAEFGEYKLSARGLEGSGQPIFEYTIFVHYCTAESIFDEESGKNAIRVTVGEFSGVSLKAMLDGEELEAGEHIITEVGAHTLTAEVNGAAADASLMPKAEDLLLQVYLYIEELESKEPFWLDLSEWDGNFYLDGEQVEGEFRVTDSGEHTLVLKDADGNELEGMFLLETASGDAETVDSVTFTFRNPHSTYAVIAAIMAGGFLLVACYFLVVRRRIV